MTGGRKVWLWAVPATLVAGAACVAAFWNWDWFLPIVDARASAALGRKVTAAHIHVSLGRVTRVSLDDVRIANPAGFPQDRDFATVRRLTVAADVGAYLHDRAIVLPEIALERPVVDAEQKSSGEANWTLPRSPSQPDAKPSPPPRIGALRIDDGHAHVVDPKLKSDFNIDLHTTPPREGDAGRIVADAHGTYAAAPITGTFTGGALLSLRDKAQPYPVKLHLANGPTTVDLEGTLTQPLTFGGANLRLAFAGPDMARLYQLTGVPIPETPPFHLTGNLDYAEHKIKFQHFAGRLGSSDLNGEIDVDPTESPPLVEADLASRRVDLTDLGGFLGTTPGRKTTKGETAAETAAQARRVEKAEASARLLPTTPLNVPRLKAATVHLRYKGERIQNKYVPLDNMTAILDMKDGHLTLHPLKFGVGRGDIAGDIELDGSRLPARVKASIDFHRVDLSRVMEATHLFHGSGIIGGSAEIAGEGASIADLLGHGDGGVKLFITGGGNISALLVDLAGLEFGNALLSSLGIPQRANLECFVSDLPLKDGMLQTRTMLLDTDEARVTITGDANLRTEQLDYVLRAQAKHFSIGSLPAPIGVEGTFKNPSIKPHLLEAGARAGAAAGLAAVFPPLALLPTIQLGLGEDNACARAVRTAEDAPGPPAKPPARDGH